MPKNTTFLLCIASVYTLLLIYFSLADADSALPDKVVPYQDKYLHFFAYTLLAFLWGFYMNSTKLKAPFVLSFLATLAFGIVLESVQETINPSRTTDVFDLIANCIGVLIGTLVAIFYQKSKVKIT